MKTKAVFLELFTPVIAYKYGHINFISLSVTWHQLEVRAFERGRLNASVILLRSQLFTRIESHSLSQSPRSRVSHMFAMVAVCLCFVSPFPYPNPKARTTWMGVGWFSAKFRNDYLWQINSRTRNKLCTLRLLRMRVRIFIHSNGLFRLSIELLLRHYGSKCQCSG